MVAHFPKPPAMGRVPTWTERVIYAKHGRDVMKHHHQFKTIYFS